jgi:hypothetical protein
MAYSAFRSFRWRRLAAAGLGAATVLTATGVSAQETHYTDVEAGVWYEEAAAALLDSGALDAGETRLRPNELATRAEVLKLLVNVYGEDLVSPATPSFTDVSRDAWYYPYVEPAARAGWIKGDRDCYGTGTRPCTARPADRVNRAEMATLLQRAYRLSYLKLAPEFPDNARGQWYHDPIQTAADHCILEGDGVSGTVRPAASMNRAEMVVIFHRASMGMRYGDDCGSTMRGDIVSVTPTASDRVMVTFNVDLDANRLGDADRYMLERTSNGSDVDVTDVTVLTARTVELELDGDLSDDASYRVAVDDMRTERGVAFDDSQIFTFREDEIDDGAGISGEIESVTVRDDDTIRVRFDGDVESTFADDRSRYSVERTSNHDMVDVDSVTVVDDRTVDLNLGDALATGVTYRVMVEGIRPEDGDTGGDDDFDDSMTFTSSVATDVTIQNVTALSSTRLRVTFSEDVDEARAEDAIRYRLSGFGGDVGIDSVGMTDDNVVEIVLDDPLVGQDLYTLTVTNLLNADDESFTDDIPFVYAPANLSFSTTLNGAKETPPTSSSATGTGTFTLTSSGLQYDITLRGLSGSVITGAHFHHGDIGVAGPVVEPITFNASTLRATGTWTDLTAEERSELLDGDVYVNVHTAAYPDGEIRGQVLR